ncbi:glycosyltransferase [Congregibacter sp.]|uniref:glycosyltransferase n=1 Tax=Congregibacter sp. TaxID=2744308 RepID=UPI003F6B621B
MKILVYSDYSRINHSVRPEAEIFLQLASMGHTVSVFSPRLDPAEPFTAAGIRTATTAQTAKVSPTSIRLLRRELRRENYDVVFATSSRTIPTAAFACMGFNCKLVVYRGTTRGLKRSDPTSFLSVLHPRVDAVLTVSDAVSEAVRKKLYKNRDKVVSIFKGHDIEWYKDPPADLAEFSIPPNAVVAIAVARFRPSKGLRYLLEASELLADIEPLHLLIVGSGADQAPYTSIVMNSPMRDRIHITGRREDALRLIAAADMLVQPSVDGEGLPRSIIEALAFGKPVISTTAGGAKEVVEEGKSGLIIPPANSVAIARSIRALAAEPETIQTMSEHCRNLVRTRLSHTKTAAAYEQFFQSLCSEQAPIPRSIGDHQGIYTAVAPDYLQHRAAILKLLENFDASGEILHRKRNTVKKMLLCDTPVVVKSFNIPRGIRAFIYGRVRKSKARRSFEHARRLRTLGISTPEPIAFIEERRRGQLAASHYVSEYFPHDFSMTYGFSGNEDSAIINAFTQFTFDLHEAGVLHWDHNPSNTLVRDQAGAWEFTIIDINRMRFGSLSLKQRMKNFVRLTDDISTMKNLAHCYARLAGEHPELCETLLMKQKQRHWRKLALKKQLKRLFGKGPR